MSDVQTTVDSVNDMAQSSKKSHDAPKSVHLTQGDDAGNAQSGTPQPANKPSEQTNTKPKIKPIKHKTPKLSAEYSDLTLDLTKGQGPNRDCGCLSYRYY